MSKDTKSKECIPVAFYPDSHQTPKITRTIYRASGRQPTLQSLRRNKSCAGWCSHFLQDYRCATLLGWRPSLVGWSPLLVGWRPSLLETKRRRGGPSPNHIDFPSEDLCAIAAGDLHPFGLCELHPLGAVGGVPASTTESASGTPNASY